MKINEIHSWDLSPKEAIRLQRKLANELNFKALYKFDLSKRKIIAGVDVSYSRVEKIGFAAVVVWDAKKQEVIEESTAEGEVGFPYVPGLLSFREAPLALKALKKIKSKIDFSLFDGQGIAHPRGIGLASHLGLFINKPSIGCAKSKLFGSYNEPGVKQGARSFLFDEEKIIGVVLRTKRRCKPVFISVGHFVDLETSVAVVSSTLTKYRIPEPLRLADLLTKKLRKSRNL